MSETIKDYEYMCDYPTGNAWCDHCGEGTYDSMCYYNDEYDDNRNVTQHCGSEVCSNLSSIHLANDLVNKYKGDYEAYMKNMDWVDVDVLLYLLLIKEEYETIIELCKEDIIEVEDLGIEDFDYRLDVGDDADDCEAEDERYEKWVDDACEYLENNSNKIIIELRKNKQNKEDNEKEEKRISKSKEYDPCIFCKRQLNMYSDIGTNGLSCETGVICRRCIEDCINFRRRNEKKLN